ncbi:hypothetical protein DCG74_09185 [Bradyrhizobium sp. WBAH42]|nr:hypothetical protein [Bradyrhizobium sp. WBAH30]MDD1545091.1 hypothetical protein [Bradyrhizobium sp. WBAH41]MDD1558520.1 hypothetical protein [Bradyrhizobium sp. WBAH23]MDD1565918.1 hypothetical protein [Bradyrhizobium sp. WBAH33]MDD1591298.1 hypothetical protein [Bradyrhizobium sp. WBAH42]NRB89596.1 hypothetical protein [Bradyrhizobium sp. WBAH10]QCJ88718.1 hypothetical protein DAA57_09535 [Bradyrhizobium yuanmingense]
MRRSNPESLRGKTLDCFAALAMTRLWQGAFHTLGVIARLDRAIQYAGAAVGHREAAAYWIPRFRGE